MMREEFYLGSTIISGVLSFGGIIPRTYKVLKRIFLIFFTFCSPRVGKAQFRDNLSICFFSVARNNHHWHLLKNLDCLLHCQFFCFFASWRNCLSDKNVDDADFYYFVACLKIVKIRLKHFFTWNRSVVKFLHLLNLFRANFFRQKTNSLFLHRNTMNKIRFYALLSAVAW